MGHVIVVGGDFDFRRMLHEELGRSGHELTAASAAAAVDALLASGLRAELFVLDARCCGDDGSRLVRRIRERLDPRIVLLTHEGEEACRAAGADDWLSPKTEPAALAARIDAALRRMSASEDALAFGPYRLDLRAFDVLDGQGRSLGLLPMEVDLVAAFATNPGRVLTRSEILRLAPPRGGETNGRSIDHRVTRLRRKLERDPARPELIRTVRGGGYVFPGAWRGSR